MANSKSLEKAGQGKKHIILAPFFRPNFSLGLKHIETQTASLTVVDGDFELLWYTEANYMCD